MMRIAFVDDEVAVLDKLMSFVEQYNIENEGANILAESFLDGLSFLDGYKYNFDAVFLDIEMPFKDGLKIAEELRKTDENVPIAFITNMANYAVKGYTVSACGFIVKPVNYYDFASLLKKLQKRCETDGNRESIMLMHGYSAVKLYISDILYVSVLGHKLQFHLTNGVVETWGSIKEYDERLSPRGFARCNSCYLVNLRHVSYIDGNDVKVGGEVLPVSRNKKKEFFNKVAQYVGR